MDITLTLPNGQTKKTFVDAAAAITWMEEEQAAWTGIAVGHRYADLLRKGLMNAANILATAPDVRQEQSQSKFNQWMSRSGLQNHINYITLLSSDTKFQFLKMIETEYPLCTTIVANYIMTSTAPPTNKPEGLMAIQLIGQFLLPKHKASLVPQHKAFDDLTAKIESRIRSLDTKMNAVEDAAGVRRLAEEKASEDTLILAATAVEERLSKDSTHLRKLLHDLAVDANAAVGRINETDKHFRENLSLNPAFTYWTKKAAAHTTKANNLRNRLYGAGGITSAILLLALITLLIKSPDLGTWADARTILVGGMTVTLTTGMFWTARLMTRLYLGNVHLANDARERATLIKTYLALNIAGKATDTDRALMLATVFRPSTDGVVRDDAAPIINAAAIFGKG